MAIDLTKVADQVIKLIGTSSSGFHGHRGRPGHRGGSLPMGAGYHQSQYNVLNYRGVRIGGFSWNYNEAIKHTLDRIPPAHLACVDYIFSDPPVGFESWAEYERKNGGLVLGAGIPLNDRVSGLNLNAERLAYDPSGTSFDRDFSGNLNLVLSHEIGHAIGEHLRYSWTTAQHKGIGAGWERGFYDLIEKEPWSRSYLGLTRSSYQDPAELMADTYSCWLNGSVAQQDNLRRLLKVKSLDYLFSRPILALLEIQDLAKQFIKLGSRSSGHHGHKGIPKHRGGSLPRGEAYYGWVDDRFKRLGVAVDGFDSGQKKALFEILHEYPRKMIRGLVITNGSKDMWTEFEQTHGPYYAGYYKDADTIFINMERLSIHNHPLNTTRMSLESALAHEIGHRVLYRQMSSEFKVDLPRSNNTFWDYGWRRLGREFLDEGSLDRKVSALPHKYGISFYALGTGPEEFAADAFMCWKMGTRQQQVQLSNLLNYDLPAIFESNYERLSDQQLNQWAVNKFVEQKVLRQITKLGGLGSGNKGHKGIPHHRGGSLPMGASSNIFVTSPSLFNPRYEQVLEHIVPKDSNKILFHLPSEIIIVGTESTSHSKLADELATKIPHRPSQIEDASVHLDAYFNPDNTISHLVSYLDQAGLYLGLTPDRYHEAVDNVFKAMDRLVLQGWPKGTPVDLVYPYGDRKTVTVKLAEPIEDLILEVIAKFGGPGSGHRGHKGIPNHRGGSLPRSRAGLSYSDQFPVSSNRENAIVRAGQSMVDPKKDKFFYVNERFDKILQDRIMAQAKGSNSQRARVWPFVYHVPTGTLITGPLNTLSGFAEHDVLLNKVYGDDFGSIHDRSIRGGFLWGKSGLEKITFDTEECGYELPLHKALTADLKTKILNDVFKSLDKMDILGYPKGTLVTVSDWNNLKGIDVPIVYQARLSENPYQMVRLGSAKSGHYGHKGIPHHRGGSLPQVAGAYSSHLKTAIPIKGYPLPQIAQLNKLLESYPPEHLKGLSIVAPDDFFDEDDLHVAGYDYLSQQMSIKLDKIALDRTYSLDMVLAHEIGHHVAHKCVASQYRVSVVGRHTLSAPYWDDMSDEMAYERERWSMTRHEQNQQYGFSYDTTNSDDLAAESYGTWKFGSSEQKRKLAYTLELSNLDDIFKSNPRYSECSNIQDLAKQLIKLGSVSSGHHGHKGRPGIRGGSLPGEAGSFEANNVRIRLTGDWPPFYYKRIMELLSATPANDLKGLQEIRATTGATAPGLYSSDERCISLRLPSFGRRNLESDRTLEAVYWHELGHHVYWYGNTNVKFEQWIVWQQKLNKVNQDWPYGNMDFQATGLTNYALGKRTEFQPCVYALQHYGTEHQKKLTARLLGVPSLEHLFDPQLKGSLGASSEWYQEINGLAQQLIMLRQRTKTWK